MVLEWYYNGITLYAERYTGTKSEILGKFQHRESKLFGEKEDCRTEESERLEELVKSQR